MGSSAVAKIIKNEEKIINELNSNVAANGSERNKFTAKINPPNYKDIDSAVDTWFAHTTNFRNVVIGRSEIKAQTLKYAVFLNHSEFTASNGWFDKFRERHNILFKK